MSNTTRPRTFTSEASGKLTWLPNGYVAANRSSSYVNTWTEWRNGSEDPFWWKKVRDLENATGNLNAFKVEIGEHRVPFYAVRDVTGGYSYEGFFMPTVLGAIPSSISSVVPAVNEAENEARTAFYSECQSKIQEIQSLVELGELAETVNFVTGTMRGIRRHTVEYLRNAMPIIRGYILNPASALRDLRDLYLAYTYAVKPLMGSIEDAYGVLTNDFRVKRGCQGVGGGEIDRRDMIFAGPQFSTINQADCALHTFVCHKSTVKVLYRGLLSSARFNGSTAAQATQRLGIQFQDFVPSIWELLPWSFVADYVSNVGNVLYGLSFDRRYFRWVYRTQEVRHEFTGKVAMFYSASGNRYETGGSVPFTLRQVTRAQISHNWVPIPDFALEIPDMHQLFNILALLSTQRWANQLVHSAHLN